MRPLMKTSSSALGRSIHAWLFSLREGGLGQLFLFWYLVRVAAEAVPDFLEPSRRKAVPHFLT